MKKPLLVFVLLALCAVLPVASQGTAKPVVAVLPFQAVEVSAAVARSVSALIETALVNTKACTVVSQGDRDRILQAQETALADCADDACAVRIGKLLSATQIVVGEVVGLGKKIIVNAKIIDINTGEIRAADTRSALTEEELEQLCRRLTRTLTEGILPAVAAQLPSEPEEKGVAAGMPAEATEEAAAAVEPAAEKAGRRQPKKPATAAALAPEQRLRKATGLTNTGAIVMQAASIASAISFELQQTSEKAYTSYLEASADVQDFYSAYAWAYAGHLALGLGADGLWAAGATAVAAAVFKYPEETFVLSRSGRALFAASWSLILSGNVLGLLAGNQYYTNEKLYQDYLLAAADIEDFRKTYEAGHAWYLTSRILSYSFWGLGGAGLVFASLLPGEKSPILSGPRDRWLMAGGTALVAAGSLLQSMALNTRELAEDRYQDYLAASADVEEFYNSYLSARTQNVIYSILAYTFWAGGGAGILGALFADPDQGRPAKESRAVFMVVPAPAGLSVWVSIDPEGMRL